MTQAERENLIRQYAAGAITWHALRKRGFDDFVQVLGALGELGLRQPLAPMTGPNRAAREHGCVCAISFGHGKATRDRQGRP